MWIAGESPQAARDREEADEVTRRKDCNALAKRPTAKVVSESLE